MVQKYPQKPQNPNYVQTGKIHAMILPYIVVGRLYHGSNSLLLGIILLLTFSIIYLV